jgi:transposase
LRRAWRSQWRRLCARRQLRARGAILNAEADRLSRDLKRRRVTGALYRWSGEASWRVQKSLRSQENVVRELHDVLAEGRRWAQRLINDPLNADVI